MLLRSGTIYVSYVVDVEHILYFAGLVAWAVVKGKGSRSCSKQKLHRLVANRIYEGKLFQ